MAALTRFGGVWLWTCLLHACISVPLSSQFEPYVSETLSNYSSTRSNCGAAAIQASGSVAVFGGTGAVFSYDTESGLIISRSLAQSSLCPTTRCDVNGVVVVGNTAYIGIWTATYPGWEEPGVIAALSISDRLSTQSSINTESGQGQIFGMVADTNNKYAYVLVAGPGSAKIIKVNLIGFSIEGSIPAGAAMPMSAAIYGNTLLVGQAAGNILEVDLVAFDTVAQIPCSTGQINVGFAHTLNETHTSAFFGTYGDGAWCELDLSTSPVPPARTFSAPQGRSTQIVTTGVVSSRTVVFAAGSRPAGLWELTDGDGVQIATLPDSAISPQFGNIMSTCVVAHPSKQVVFYGNPNNELNFTVWAFEYTV